MNARAVAAGRGRCVPISRPPDPIQCIRGFLAVLAALAVLAIPVQCSMAMGAHSLFVDPRDMMAMAVNHAGHMGHSGHTGHTGHSGHSGHADHGHPETASEAKTAQVSGQSSQVDLPTLRQFSGFVDAASPVAVGGQTLTLTTVWSPIQAQAIIADVLQPAAAWAESPPP